MPPIKRDYGIALEEAWKALENADIPERVTSAGAKMTTDGKILLDFLGATHEIDVKKRTVIRSGEDVNVIRKILILHYLTTASGLPPTGRETGFAQITGATGYLTPFRGRIVYPLVAAFDRDKKATAAAFEKMGAVPKEFASQCFIVHAFPGVDITVIYWQGDDEMPSEGQIIFDKSVTEYLPIEDIVVCCQEMLGEVKSQMKIPK